jgi:hypothetical protein
MKNKFLVAFLLFSFCIPINSLQAQSNKEEFKKISGQWLRPDGGYVLIIKNVRFDGSIEAEYLNPNRISISKAHVKTELGKINIFVELRDVGYPGSYYTLTYDKDTDRLVGVYHHLGINQNFDVHFMRR